MHMLQQNWYNDGNRYFKWIIDNFNKSFGTIEIIYLLLYFLDGYTLLIGFICVYIISYYLFNTKVSAEQSKKPLAITARIKRLYTTMLILYLLAIIPMIVNMYTWPLNVCIVILGVLCHLNPFIILLANTINRPIEKIVFNYYKTKAKNKLKSMKSLVKVGITGSYGKTSTKNFLNDILGVKFNSFATEKSFNTMNGLMISINNKLDKFCALTKVWHLRRSLF